MQTWVNYLKAFPEKDALTIIPFFNSAKWRVEKVTRKHMVTREWSGVPTWPTRANLNDMMFFGDECGEAQAESAVELLESGEDSEMLRHGFAVWVCNRTFGPGAWELRFQAQTILFDPASSGIFYAHTFECRGPPSRVLAEELAEVGGAGAEVAQVDKTNSENDPSSMAMADFLTAWQGGSRSSFVSVFAEDAKFLLFDSVADVSITHGNATGFGSVFDTFFTTHVCAEDAELRMVTVGSFDQGTIGVGELRAGGTYRGLNLLVTAAAREPEPGRYEITRLYALWTETFYDRLMAGEALV